MSSKLCITRRNLVRSAGIAVGSGAAFGALGRRAEAATMPYHIALSNSYIGNQWRVEMVNLTKAYARRYHAKNVILSVTSSGVDVQRQIAAIDDMISRGVAAILVNPASESGLNPVIAQATQRGIVVVDFDHAVSAPSAYKVHVDFVKFGEIHGKWLADTLNGKGNVIMNRGVPGFEGDQAEYKGAMNVFKNYPGIKIIAEIYGRWDENVTQAEMTKALTAHPNVDGVLNQAGAYGATQAFLNLHHKFVPMTGEASNGWRLAMLKYKDQGLKGISAGDPPALGAYALKVAVEILEGRGPKYKDILVGIPILTTDQLKPGVNVFPDQPATVYDDINIPDSGFELTMSEALGK